MATTRRADMFIDLKDDPRENRPTFGPSTMSLLGLERFVAEAPSLDITGNDPWQGQISLREVLVEMIHEYARHLGHADLLRERIDGRIGQ